MNDLIFNQNPNTPSQPQEIPANGVPNPIGNPPGDIPGSPINPGPKPID